MSRRSYITDNDLAHQETYKGFEILIYQDYDAESPNQWENEDLFLVYDHRDFSVTRKGFEAQDIFEEAWSKSKSMYDGYWIFGVDAYIHSGISLAIRGSAKAAMFPDRRWDVSFKGFILVKRQKGAWHCKQAHKLAKALLEDWNNYLSSNVYAYRIPELKDSCSGFYGDYDGDYGALTEAKSIIDAHIKEPVLDSAGFDKAGNDHIHPNKYYNQPHNKD